MKIIQSPADGQVEGTDKGYDASRRGFLKLAGGIAGAGILFSACNPRSGPTNLYLGSGDTALLNFLYVIQQIEADFYTQAVATQYYGITHNELIALTDVRDQELAHKGFLQNLLGTSALAAIAPDFSAVTFADRTSMLTHAAAIEDIAVAALNSTAAYFSDTSLAIALSKMVSVEARHSAYFRDLLAFNSFSDNVLDINGLDQAGTPGSVLNAALFYSHTRYDSSNLPS